MNDPLLEDEENTELDLDVLGGRRQDDAAAPDEDQAAEPEAAPQGVDPLQLASMLCVHANNVLAKRTGTQVEKQIALAQAIATIELAQVTRAAYQLNVQMAQMAVDDRNRAVAAQQGPAGIVVPHIAPRR